MEQAKEEIANAVRVIQEREKTKSKASSVAVAKKDEEKKEPPAGGGELLPLWCMPSSHASDTTANEKSDGPSASGAAPSQQTLATETLEVVGLQNR